SASTGIDRRSRWPARAREVSTMIDDVQWFVGIDWATQSHRVCLLDVEGRHVSERDFAHGGAGLTELRDWLLEKTKAAPGQIAVAIETPHGPVVEMLLDHGFLVFAINPKQLDRFRDRFTVRSDQGRAGTDRRGDRDAARPRRGDAARSRIPGLRHQSQAARSFPRSLHGQI